MFFMDFLKAYYSSAYLLLSRFYRCTLLAFFYLSFLLIFFQCFHCIDNVAPCDGNSSLDPHNACFPKDSPLPDCLYLVKVNDYFVIKTFAHLQCIGTRIPNKYVLDDNINANGASHIPVGGINGFGGEFNGAGKKISNFKIDFPHGGNVGLFSILAEGALVKDLSLSDVDVTGDTNVGVLAGRLLSGFSDDAENVLMNNTLVRGVQNVSVSNVIVRANENVGALVGNLSRGEIINSHSIGKTSTSSIMVTGDGTGIGGLVGLMEGGIVRNSFSDIPVDASSSRSVGGLIGRIDGLDSSTISETYASNKTIEGGKDVGGLIGYLSGSNSKIVDSYAGSSPGSNTASCGGDGDTLSMSVIASGIDTDSTVSVGGVGGLVGYSESSVIESSYAAAYVRVPSNNSILGSIGGLVGILNKGSLKRSFSASLLTEGSDDIAFGVYASGSSLSRSDLAVGLLIGECSNSGTSPATLETLYFINNSAASGYSNYHPSDVMSYLYSASSPSSPDVDASVPVAFGVTSNSLSNPEELINSCYKKVSEYSDKYVLPDTVYPLKGDAMCNYLDERKENRSGVAKALLWGDEWYNKGVESRYPCLNTTSILNSSGSVGDYACSPCTETKCTNVLWSADDLVDPTNLRLLDPSRVDEDRNFVLVWDDLSLYNPDLVYKVEVCIGDMTACGVLSASWNPQTACEFPLDRAICAVSYLADGNYVYRVSSCLVSNSNECKTSPIFELGSVVQMSKTVSRLYVIDIHNDEVEATSLDSNHYKLSNENEPNLDYTLHWETSTEIANNYKLQSSEDGTDDSWTDVADILSTDKFYDIRGKALGDISYFRVIACRDDNCYSGVHSEEIKVELIN